MLPGNTEQRAAMYNRLLWWAGHFGCARDYHEHKQTYDATDFGLPDGTQRTSIYGAFVLAQGRTHFDDIF